MGETNMVTLRYATIDDKEWIQRSYLTVVPPLYEESTESYCHFWCDSFFGGDNEIGFFSLRKEVVVFEKSGCHIGFAVMTYKRGKSVKISPFILNGMRRELMAAWNLIECHVKQTDARKIYFDIPSRHWTLLSLLEFSGLRIEAHLKRQYSNVHDSLVLGKILSAVKTRAGTEVASTPSLVCKEKTLEWVEVNEQDDIALGLFVQEVLSAVYDELNEGFVRSIFTGIRNRAGGVNSKGKCAYAIWDKLKVKINALCVLTPKRGGALKLGPFQFAGDVVGQGSISEALGSLLRIVEGLGIEYRKLYALIPCHEGRLQCALRASGFEPEGVLQEPYKPGVDFIIYSRFESSEKI